MDMACYWKSVVELDPMAVVLCNLEHEILYMNPAAVKRYAKRGGAALVGRSLLACHTQESARKIAEVLAWFSESPEHNRVFTFHHAGDNADVYMVALRDDAGKLIGYYEKHESRIPEQAQPYAMQG